MVTDARQLDDAFAFDRILLDAPCSGSGTLSLTAPGPGRFTPALVEKSVRSQKALLAKGLRLLKPGQELVYSTCSILAQENEDVVTWALESPGVELVPIQGDWLEALPPAAHSSGGDDVRLPGQPVRGLLRGEAAENWGRPFAGGIRQREGRPTA